MKREPRGPVAEGEVRKLAAIMFTDMVGFSRIMSADEQNAMELLDECNSIVGGAVGHHHGRVLKTMGDAVLAEFDSAAGAVQCAVDIQTKLRDRNAAEASSERLALRIGIHVGDVIVRDQDLFGDGINVAARLEPLCDPGGVCLSEAVYQAVAANADVDPVKIGEVELKNILQRQVIYSIPSFYPNDSSAHQPEPARASLDVGSVIEVRTAPPPTRSVPAMALLGTVLGPLAVGTGVLLGDATQFFTSDSSTGSYSEHVGFLTSEVASLDWRLTLAIVSVTIIGGGIMNAWFMSLRTVRVSLIDIRDVDALLDFYLVELGFREGVRRGDHLVFRATLWTMLLYTVAKIRARASGNMVILTGPLPIMRRMERRMRALAANDL